MRSYARPTGAVGFDLRLHAEQQRSCPPESCEAATAEGPGVSEEGPVRRFLRSNSTSIIHCAEVPSQVITPGVSWAATQTIH